jgi:hypothetical protein
MRKLEIVSEQVKPKFEDLEPGTVFKTSGGKIGVKVETGGTYKEFNDSIITAVYPLTGEFCLGVLYEWELAPEGTVLKVGK